MLVIQDLWKPKICLHTGRFSSVSRVCSIHTSSQSHWLEAGYEGRLTAPSQDCWVSKLTMKAQVVLVTTFTVIFCLPYCGNLFVFLSIPGPKFSPSIK